jgi:hypothetical protein
LRLRIVLFTIRPVEGGQPPSNSPRDIFKKKKL